MKLFFFCWAGAVVLWTLGQGFRWIGVLTLGCSGTHKLHELNNILGTREQVGLDTTVHYTMHVYKDRTPDAQHDSKLQWP